MKSFQAKMYIEDELATIEFDIEMMGEADQEFGPYFGFVLYELKLTSEEKDEWKKQEGHEKIPVFLGIFDADTMKISGEMLSKINDESLPTIKEETIKFLELYLDGKICEKHNYVFPVGVNPTVLNDKHVQNGDKWEVFAKNRETGKYEKQSITRSTENDEEDIAEIKQNLEAVRNDEMPKVHPDGSSGQNWIQTHDEEGNVIVKPEEKEED